MKFKRRQVEPVKVCEGRVRGGYETGLEKDIKDL